MIKCNTRTKILILLQLIFVLPTISYIGCYAAPASAVNQTITSANNYNNQSDTFPMRLNTYTGFATIVKILSDADDIKKSQPAEQDDKKNYLKISGYGLILDDPAIHNKPNTAPALTSQIYQMYLSKEKVKEKYPEEDHSNTIISQLIKDKYRIWINAEIYAAKTIMLHINDFEIIPYKTAQLIPSNHSPNNNDNQAIPVNVKFDEVAAWTDRMPGGGGENNPRRHLLLNFSVTNPDTQNKYSINLDRIFISFNPKKEGKLPQNQITFVDENSNLPTPDTTETQISPSSENVNISLRGLNAFPPDHAENQIIYVTVIFSINKINTDTTAVDAAATHITLRKQGEIMVVW